jgi:hypothetical protein
MPRNNYLWLWVNISCRSLPNWKNVFIIVIPSEKATKNMISLYKRLFSSNKLVNFGLCPLRKQAKSDIIS